MSDQDNLSMEELRALVTRLERQAEVRKQQQQEWDARFAEMKKRWARERPERPEDTP